MFSCSSFFFKLNKSSNNAQEKESKAMVNNEDEEENIIPSDKLAAESSAQLNDELAKFRNEWKMELLLDNAKSRTKNPSQFNDLKTRSNRMEHQEFRRTRPKSQQKPPTSELDVGGGGGGDLNYEQPQTNEDKAKYLFDKAVQLEQQGRYYEAIKFYRMSMQLDADIEFKMGTNKQKISRPSTMNRKSSKPDDLEQEGRLEFDENDLNEEEEEVEENAAEILLGPKEDENKGDDELRTLYQKFHCLTIDENKICEKNLPQKVILN